ncbi:MAG: alcohol dehydrogenase catalytic domain-containing protein [Candidatus Azotimanducaceae bacterium]
MRKTKAMQALVLNNGIWSCTTSAEMPRPGPGESLVQVRYAGLCGTDLELSSGYYGFSGIPGHEFVGRVLEGPRQGMRVVADINVGCGDCFRCTSGQHRHCQQRTVIGIKGRAGAFAQYLSVPDQNLLMVPDQLSDELAVYAEPVAAALEVIEQVAEARPTEVLVIGAGRLGMITGQVLASFGVKVKMLIRNPLRAQHIQNPEIEIVSGADKDAYPWVIDCSGSKDGLVAALDATQAQGLLVLKSTVVNAGEVDLSPIMVKELNVLGSRCGPMARALNWLEAGAMEPPKAVVFPLGEVEGALNAATDPNYFKVLFNPDLEI